MVCRVGWVLRVHLFNHEWGGFMVEFIINIIPYTRPTNTVWHINRQVVHHISFLTENIPHFNQKNYPGVVYLGDRFRLHFPQWGILIFFIQKLNTLTQSCQTPHLSLITFTMGFIIS